MLLSQLSQNPIAFLYIVIAILIALTFHEFCHAWTSTKLGDPTPESLGRLSLNPLAHLDLMGTVFLLIVGFGWGKPVPFNPRYFKNPRRDIFLTAISGPVANFILAIFFAIPFRIGSMIGLDFASTTFGPLFIYILYINITLGIFNLLPIPPLDGSKMLYLFLPVKYIQLMEFFGIYILLGFILILYLTNFNLISYVVSSIGTLLTGMSFY